MELLTKIARRKATVTVVGLGYVGLPLSVEIARAGFTVYGIDSDPVKVAMLRAGKSYIMDTNDHVLTQLTGAGMFQPGTEYAAVEKADIVVLCVPTPLTADRQPDTSFIEAAISQIVGRLRRGVLLILESTTYPGTTEILLRNRIEEERGWEAGKDFYVCFSPERVDPGNKEFALRSTPKIVGGSTDACLKAGQTFYSDVFDRVVPVTSNETAELAKLLENTFRSVNIAMINELVPLCERLGVNIWEVVDAAATKPFGFMPFYPGPGVGGHCIPVDPLYLSWKAERLGIRLNFVELADEMHRTMPCRVVSRAEELLEGEGKCLAGARIAIAGVAYKKDTDDLRESPALELIGELKRKGAAVVYHDPYVPACHIDGERYVSETASPQLWSKADLVVIAVDHTTVDYQQIADCAPLVLDTRNAAKTSKGGRIVLLGSSPRPKGGGKNAK